DVERDYLRAREALGSAFDDLMDGPAGDAVFGVINTGLETMAELLPEVEPLIVASADAIRGLMEDVDPDRFGAWVDKLADLAGPSIEDTVRLLGELGGALDAVLAAGSDT